MALALYYSIHVIHVLDNALITIIEVMLHVHV